MQPTLREILYGQYPISQRLKSLYRFSKWQFLSKVLNKDYAFKFTPNTKMVLINGFHALSGNYYFGIADPDIMPFVLHVLQPNDLFVDAGANGGAYTLLASGEKKAYTVSIEAAPDTFKGLLKNIAVNKLEELVDARNIAVSNINGYVPFTSSDHATNRICYEERSDIIQVEAKTLDEILDGKVPLLIKMDIEGHEHNALLGAHNTISSQACKAIVIEFSNTGEYYGYGNNVTHQLLTEYNFRPFKYDYKTKQLISFNPLTTKFEFNMIYVKDEIFIKDRLRVSEPIVMSGKLI